MNRDDDKRPDPKPRKHPQLWQTYLSWQEKDKTLSAHQQRIGSIEAGKSNMDAQLERDIIKTYHLVEHEKMARAQLIEYFHTCGPIANWLVSIRGLGSDYLAARLVALIDDPGKFATVSKLWRYCGLGVVDGHAEHAVKGETRPNPGELKSLFLGKHQIAAQFIQHQTSPYYEYYCDYKARQQRKHPVPQCKQCHVDCVMKGTTWRCPECGATNQKLKLQWVPAHLDHMARRYMAKRFVADLWVTWRTIEGLPTGQPYVQAILGHTHITAPPGLEVS